MFLRLQFFYMKKILFLILICLIKLNAYNYLIEDNQNENNPYKQYFTNEYGNILQVVQTKEFLNSGTIVLVNQKSYGEFWNIKRSLNTQTAHYISKEDFDKIIKKDIQFLNDLYTTTRLEINNCFLNYLYNDNNFNNSNNILYQNYELLYNSEGLVVESIFNGIWKGLYDDKTKSGKLYNSKGTLAYVDGEYVEGMFGIFNFFTINENLYESGKILLQIGLWAVIGMIVFFSAFRLSRKVVANPRYRGK